ncbi:MAG TPA: TIGR02328 family protein [Bacillales bacterium]
MRLWHESLISLLPRQQLLGQHRECCALRGKGWGKKHATVHYVFHYSPERLYRYHIKVINEMKKRGYKVDPLWKNPLYRGKQCTPYDNHSFHDMIDSKQAPEGPIYPEHDQTYLKECMENLYKKGIQISLIDIKKGHSD